MIVMSIQDACMQIEAPVDRDALEQMRDQVGAKLPHPRREECGIYDAVRSPAQVDRHESKRLVHGHKAMSCANDAAPIAQRSIQCLAQANTHILGSVVLVHMQIASGTSSYVK